ncbi:MAG: hypothetical protein J6Y59_05925 [Bacteroidaceae bacterium]|nr:hypothetical protein [Bacteroidaceae bacterium]
MKKNLVFATLLLVALSGQAQEKVMNILKTDGTNAQTRVADMKQISFLAVEAGDQGLLVKTLDGETAFVLFESNPVVTISNGKLTVKPSSATAMRFEINDIAEILFGDESDATPIRKTEGFAFVMQDGSVLLRNIPKGIKPCIYSIDGRNLPTPPFQGGELRLSRATLGPGIFIVKVGTLSTKIKL